MSVEAAQPETTRKVGIGLGIGIFLLPIVFSWFLLRKGHSTVSKVLGFGWLGLGLLIMISSPSSGTTAKAAPGQAAQVAVAAPAPPPPAPRISAASLQAIYKQNEIAADEQYKGKVLEIEGVVEAISKDAFGNLYLTIRSGAFLGLHAEFDDEHKSELATLRAGQRVLIRGRVDGFLMDSVMVKSCQLVR
jgi:hypothetical protein